jgi:hypothetical protein
MLVRFLTGSLWPLPVSDFFVAMGGWRGVPHHPKHFGHPVKHWT